MADALDGSVRHGHSQQQRLFRLFQAMRANDLDQAQDLLDAGAPIDLPLQLSEAAGGPPRAEQFRFHELPELASLTVLGYAAGRGEYDHVIWLLQRMASVSAPFSGGRDAAWLAMEMGQVDIMSSLLDKGASIGLRVKDGKDTTRLIAATRAGNLQAVEALLQRKARPNAYDAVGRTALHYNFEKDPYTDADLQIGRLLIDWGGNPAAMDQAGTLPADLAHCDPQYALLRAHGLERRLRQADPDVVEPESQPEAEPDGFDPKDIVRPSPDDPGTPQLNRVPVFKKPRF